MTSNEAGTKNGWKSYTKLPKALALSCWIVAFGASEAQAATQHTVDLICESRRGVPIRFRFDLQQKQWCMAECPSVWAIDKLADSMIELSLQTKDDSQFWSINIDRYTSKFWAVRRGAGSEPQDWGQCKTAPFSGFPQKKF